MNAEATDRATPSAGEPVDGESFDVQPGRPRRWVNYHRRLIKVGVVSLVACLWLANTYRPSSGAPAQAVVPVDLTTTGLVATSDQLGLGPRLVFSTAAGRARGQQYVDLHNATGAPVHVASVTSSSSAFGVDSTARSFWLNADEHRRIGVAFTPRSAGAANATLRFALTSGDSFDIPLGGLNATNFEANLEPNLQQIFDALGYKVNVGMPSTPPTNTRIPKHDRLNSIGLSKAAIGDEVLIKGFQQVDTAKPVRLVPLASYVGRSSNIFGWFGINQRGSATAVQATVALPGGRDAFGGQNQQLLPGLGDGDFSALMPTSSLSFMPEFRQFGIWDGYRHIYSEDSLNAGGQHEMRIYPAVATDGLPIAHAYLVADDSGTPSYTNFDYQDAVFLVTNVTPVA